MTRIAALIGCLTVPAMGSAQEVQPCDWQAQAQSIVEPWEDNSRTFANGAVRVALLDTIEPAAAAMHLLILSPPFTEVGDRTCQTVGSAGGAGFTRLDFQALEAGYHPETGLSLTFPATMRDPETGQLRRAFLALEINQQTGVVRANLLADLQ